MQACKGRPYCELTAAVLPSSLMRTHPFALVYSTCLPVSVCGTDPQLFILRSFSRKNARPNPLIRRSEFCQHLGFCLADFPTKHPHASNANPIRRLIYYSSSLLRKAREGRNINRLSIPLNLSVKRLGPPNPWLIAIAKETLGFRRPDLLPGLRLLMPTFSLPFAPPILTNLASARRKCSPTFSLFI